MSLDASHFPDSHERARITFRRIGIALAAMSVLMVMLLARTGYLQIAEYQRYTTLSRENRIRLVPVPPTRGLIYDRNNRLLAGNRPVHRLVVTPEEVINLDATLQALGRIVDLAPSDLERFHKRHRKRRPFEEIPLKLRLSEEEVARFAVDRHRFPGVELRARLARVYPHAEVASHVLGYVGALSARELQQVDRKDYRGIAQIGKSGIERAYEGALRGTPGFKHVETNARGRALRILDREQPVPGRSLRLTLDVRLQRVAEQALRAKEGAVVTMDPRNGEILALASTPRFDPNRFANGISAAEFDRLRSRREQPLFNRAIRGQYPPGSTIKPFIALAGLAKGLRTPDEQVNCKGWYSLPGIDHRWRDWKRHGLLNLKQAIAQSCDVYFYDLAHELGIDAIHDFLAPFGFGRTTGIDLPGERAGVLPSRAWKRRTQGEPWYPGETVIAGIGQGYMLSTPLQLATATATLANRGERVSPHLLKSPREGVAAMEGATSAAPEPLELGSPGHWGRVIAGMIETVHGRQGTARAIGRDAPYTIAGKTGTAQVVGVAEGDEYDAASTPEHLRDHALFIGFAPADDPLIAVAVVVENGGGGSKAAAPVARRMMDAWLRNMAAADDSRQNRPTGGRPGDEATSPPNLRQNVAGQ